MTTRRLQIEKSRREEDARREDALRRERKELEKEREELIEWLRPFDYHSKHQSSTQLRHENTCGWLLENETVENWRSGSDSRFLWLYGIPGAGKTVLLSSIIEDVKSLCKADQSKDVACVYYYYYFERSQDETSPLLGWAVDQLIRCCQYIPNEILDCFRASQQPSVPTLVVALSSLAKKFKKIY